MMTSTTATVTKVNTALLEDDAVSMIHEQIVVIKYAVVRDIENVKSRFTRSADANLCIVVKYNVILVNDLTKFSNASKFIYGSVCMDMG